MPTETPRGETHSEVMHLLGGLLRHHLGCFLWAGAGLGAGLGFGVFAALLGYSLFPNMMLPTRTLVAPTSIFDRWENTYRPMVMSPEKCRAEHWDMMCFTVFTVSSGGRPCLPAANMRHTDRDQLGLCVRRM
ncbi:hypothetical protein INR49_000495 [Caranx melampygus]|nr:hypothetical protein INR49_000495 [Caranx melampygus]